MQNWQKNLGGHIRNIIRNFTYQQKMFCAAGSFNNASEMKKSFFTINMKNLLPGVDGTMTGNYMLHIICSISCQRCAKTFGQG